MAFNLVKAGEATEDALTKGIIEMMLKDSPILQELPFVTVEGNSLTYWQELYVKGLAAWKAAGGDWGITAAPETKKLTATLAILGGDIDFDNFLRRTRPRPEDYEAALVEAKAKAMRYEFENTFVNGDPDLDPNQPMGLYRLLTEPRWNFSTDYALGDYVYPNPAATTGEPYAKGYKYVCVVAGKSSAGSQPTWPEAVGEEVIDGGVTWRCEYGQLKTLGPLGLPLSLSALDALIDLVKGGPPQLLLMSPRTRRDVNKLIRASGAALVTREGIFNEVFQLYNGVTIGVSDWIKDNYQLGTNGTSDCSVIFAFQMSEQAVAGVSSPDMIATERLGKLEAKDAERIRLKWYVSVALFGLPRAAILTGVRPA